MLETSKATKRRRLEQRGEVCWWDIFNDSVILDVGAGTDPLEWPEARCVIPFDLPDGGGDMLTRFFSPSFKVDVIHGSQVLEHALNPSTMLTSWIMMVRPGGFIVFTVPDWELYEKRTFPSKWNSGHNSTWSMDSVWGSPNHIKLPEWLGQFGCSILRCKLIDTNYDRSVPLTIDQTLNAKDGVECFIEVVLLKNK